jgi:uncharacterized protein YndB with AHSA1/START domain
MSRRSILALVACATLLPATAAAQTVRDESHAGADGARVLQLSIDVPAEQDAVWRAFTTSEGFSSWAAPFAVVDFRLGGFIEASYAPNSTAGAPTNIRNEIVAYVPLRMLAIRNRQAPPGAPFDAATFQRLHTVILFEPAATGSTRVTVLMPGVGSGEAFDGVYRHFERGNAWTLQQLHKRFTAGPIDWARK